MTSICDERGQELIYAGMPITEVFKEEMGLGGVLGLLWFQRRLVYTLKVVVLALKRSTYMYFYKIYFFVGCHAMPASSLRCA